MAPITIPKQLTFWDGPLSEMKPIWVELYDLKEKQNNLRRGLFSRFDFMKKEMCELKEELANLKLLVKTFNGEVNYELLRNAK